MLLTKPVTGTFEFPTKMPDGSVQNVVSDYTLPAGTETKLLTGEELARARAAVAARIKAANTTPTTAPAK